MTNAKNMLEISLLKPDFIGFIFHKPSSRFFDGTIPKLPETTKKTGVFVDSNLKTIENLINQHELHAVQLHGSETPQLCQSLKSKHVEVIKVFSVDENFNFSKTTPFEGTCDYYLFDTKGKLPGGNGITFNWSILQNYKGQTPFLLSGGLGLDNVNEIKLFMQSPLSEQCAAIDLNSKFETSPGIKSKFKLETFINQIKL